MIEFTHVHGDDSVKLKLYTLSTCGWCRKTKALLGDLGASYDYVDVDLLEGDDIKTAEEEIKKWNPACSFPTIIVNGEKCIIGFNEEEIRSVLGK